MEFKLFDDYITLQALLKTTGILHSGGAIKGFLEENTILFNGEDEKRRGKKIRVGDVITLPDHNTSITIVAPSAEEIKQHQEDQAEKERVAAIVKKLNQENKKNKKQVKTPKKAIKNTERKPVRFPGM
ncbi:TPA: S4 domain-containing protein YaaA [Streptococcus suis]|uniref:S4 domain-containing protein YaaA n=1 Tax=Streptococcus suis TaxID=1307 RepID=UPI000CF38BCE|nr:S4 domain-containing protein YaaA [Streptococcus suis]MBY4975095.1 S4 domain-containing protein YaaA [Streptococcus suis]MDG4500439.1 S4 domain-containing protein YaaA [Streptococcus suis]MDG4507689.1 S4 domain-containing protein YaaA [Streptococcus suis]MDG4510293.1 S4 domain-containing protein YaaA [Streptococcus suis]NQM08290.1 S4 domain-containing protein YaaA [Streptococcus suis]